MKRKLRRAALLSLCCIALLATSCVDLGEVTKFAAQAATAQSSLASLVADFKGTCERFNQFAPSREKQQDCGKYDKLSSGTVAAQQVLLNYMQALGTLSSDQKITFDQDLKALPDKLKNSGMDAKQLTATTTLASKLADAAINGYRRKKISQLVGQENEDVQTVTSALIKIVGTDYKLLLGDEAAAMEDYYRTPLKEEGKERRLDAVLVTNLWRDQQSDLAKKQAAAEAYVTIMKSVAEGHQKLYEQRNKFTVKELVETLGPDIGAIASATQTVHEAFK